MNQPSGTTPQGPLNDDPPPSAQGAQASPPLAGEEPQAPRRNTRRALPVESPGRLVLANGQSLYVTLHDISRGGCCVVRKGQLALQPEERVQIEIWREAIQTKATLAASVRWVRHQDGRSRAGLRFLDTSIRTYRTIDQYLQRSFTPGD